MQEPAREYRSMVTEGVGLWQRGGRGADVKSQAGRSVDHSLRGHAVFRHTDKTLMPSRMASASSRVKLRRLAGRPSCPVDTRSRRDEP